MTPQQEYDRLVELPPALAALKLIPIGVNEAPVILSVGCPWWDGAEPLPPDFWARVLAGTCPQCAGALEDVTDRTTVDGKPLKSGVQSWRICRPCIVSVYLHRGRKDARGQLAVTRHTEHLASHV